MIRAVVILVGVVFGAIAGGLLAALLSEYQARPAATASTVTTESYLNQPTNTSKPVRLSANYGRMN